ncbi:transporter substrate-binding domain-containing protein [Paenibacillus sp. FSL R5-0407]|uniref:substrate-binding periplasmic protein n=1 Tax=Paenibacillus TaxID=44249 RepID=UPI0025B6A3BF|nr:transporter substrate-binding domain-containing protein [Paenibacillus vini]MDN4068603.1 transporter substrate-binding domain-containing protein [Paenibacillus vini]
MKSRKRKSLFFMTLIAALTLVLSACGNNAGNNASQTPPAGNDQAQNESNASGGKLLEQIKSKGKITIGLMGTYAPYNFVNENNEVDGYDADLSKEIAKRIGVEANFVTGEFSGLIEGLQKGKYDALVSQVTITEDRKKSIDFSEPYVKNDVSIIVKDNNDSIQSVEDFKGKKVGVALGTNDEAYLRDEVLPKVGDFEIVTYNDNLNALMDLNNGRIDATINNVFALKPLIESNNLKLKTVGEPLKSDFAGVAMPKNNPDLQEAVNKALQEIKDDGTLKTLYNKWFDVDPNF